MQIVVRLCWSDCEFSDGLFLKSTKREITKITFLAVCNDVVFKCKQSAKL